MLFVFFFFVFFFCCLCFGFWFGVWLRGRSLGGGELVAMFCLFLLDEICLGGGGIE